MLNGKNALNVQLQQIYLQTRLQGELTGHLAKQSRRIVQPKRNGISQNCAYAVQS